MLIVGYCYGIRSEQASVRGSAPQSGLPSGFAGLGLEGKVPDHSTFSENRHGRFRESDALRRLFELGVARGAWPKVWSCGEGFAVPMPASVKADASRQHHRDDDAGWGNGRAVREYLEAVDDG